MTKIHLCNECKVALKKRNYIKIGEPRFQCPHCKKLFDFHGDDK